MNAELRGRLKQAVSDARRARLLAEGDVTAQPDGIIHGTEDGYQHHRCRCQPCRAAQNTARAARRNRQNSRLAAGAPLP